MRMMRCYTLPKPTFRDWLFGIAPVVMVRADDVVDGNEAVIRLEHRGREFGRIVSKFRPDETNDKEI
jgi:hypothetical protein